MPKTLIEVKNQVHGMKQSNLRMAAIFIFIGQQVLERRQVSMWLSLHLKHNVLLLLHADTKQYASMRSSRLRLM
jgi:hypothetical protein